MQHRTTDKPRTVSIRSGWWLAALLATLLALSAWAALVSWRNVDLQAQDQFEQKFERLDTSVRSQFRPIGNALHGIMGLYAAD